MQKFYMKRTRLLFSTNYSTVCTKFYSTLKIEAILNLTIFVLFSFLSLHNIREHMLNISKTIFPKMIFHLRLSYQLPDVFLQEFYIH